MTEPQTDPLPPAIPLQPLIEHYKQDPRMTHTKWVQWACDCAERALPVFESARPSDMRPRRALEAARTWIANPTEKNKEAAAAAAAAADAAYAAADAAYAAAYAADAAAHAAYAAVRAVRAAAHATYAASDSNAEKTWQAIRLMEIYQWD